MRIVFLSFLLFVSLPLFAQPAAVTLNGSLIMTTGETFPYKVVLTEANGVVSGYSITYEEPNDTKTKLLGTLDRHNHTLLFKETEIVYSHNVHTKAYMCLVDAKLAYEPSRENRLKGPITSKQTDKTSCTAGTLVFSNSDEIQALFSYHEKGDTMITMRKKVKEPAADPVKTVPVDKPEPIVDKVTAGIEKAYDWYSDSVVIDIWDGGTTDGDMITLLFNGKPYLTNYYLVKAKKQLRIPLDKAGVNTISIVAVNEGSDPPNTASLQLTDGTARYSLLAYNNKGQQSLIKIRKVNKR